jgi:hypothetical protein
MGVSTALTWRLYTAINVRDQVKTRQGHWIAQTRRKMDRSGIDHREAAQIPRETALKNQSNLLSEIKPTKKQSTLTDAPCTVADPRNPSDPLTFPFPSSFRPLEEEEKMLLSLPLVTALSCIE